MTHLHTNHPTRTVFAAQMRTRRHFSVFWRFFQLKFAPFSQKGQGQGYPLLLIDATRPLQNTGAQGLNM